MASQFINLKSRLLNPYVVFAVWMLCTVWICITQSLAGLEQAGQVYVTVIARATLSSDGTIDGRISNRDREQVLEHYLAAIASVYDRLYEAIEQDQPVDLSHLTLAR